MREPKLIIATGGKSVGKTYQTCKVIERYIKHNPINGKEGRKVLIFDVNFEYTNDQLKKDGHSFETKILSERDLIKFAKQKRPEVRRILPIDDKGHVMSIDKMVDLLERIVKYYKGGLLVLEDINRYLVDTRTAEIIGMMATNRHRDLDIYIHLQSLSPVTTRMWQNCALVRFHRQNDDVNRYKQRLPLPELYFIAQTLVNSQVKKDKRFFCYVDNELSRIRGKFSKRVFMVACYNYVMSNPRNITSAQKRFGTGKKAYNTAVAWLIKDLTERYYGNDK